MPGRLPAALMLTAIAVIAVHTQAPSFEIASIRKNSGVNTGQNARFLPGGRIEATYVKYQLENFEFPVAAPAIDVEVARRMRKHASVTTASQQRSGGEHLANNCCARS